MNSIGRFLLKHILEPGAFPSKSFPERKYEVLQQKLRDENYPVKSLEEFRNILSLPPPPEFDQLIQPSEGLSSPTTVYRGERFQPKNTEGHILWDDGKYPSRGGTRSMQRRAKELGTGILPGNKYDSGRFLFDEIYTSTRPRDASGYSGADLSISSNPTLDNNNHPVTSMFYRIQLPEGMTGIKAAAPPWHLRLPLDTDFQINDIHRVGMEEQFRTFGSKGMKDLFMIELEAKLRGKK